MDKRIRSILERTKERALFEDSTRDLFEENEYRLIGGEEIEEEQAIEEGKVITFDGGTYPREGWAVVMSGATGSGKGVVIKNQLLIDGKVIDVDKLKKLYAAVDELKRGRSWDFDNPEDVRKLHNLVKSKGWDDRVYDLFFDSNNGRLNNIIFDITGKTVGKLTRYSSMASDIGYKISLVWVVTNRMWAMLRNLARDRVVPEDIFHEIHNLTSKSVFTFLDSNANRFVDEAWVVFSGDMGDVKPEGLPDSAEDLAGTVHKIEKRGGQFTLPKKLKRKIMMHLGPIEPDINDPERYKDFEDVEQEMEPYEEEYWDEEDEEWKTRWVGYDDGMDFMQHDQT